MAGQVGAVDPVAPEVMADLVYPLPEAMVEVEGIQAIRMVAVVPAVQVGL
jgi:hypothetical protein